MQINLCSSCLGTRGLSRPLAPSLVLLPLVVGERWVVENYGGRSHVFFHRAGMPSSTQYPWAEIARSNLGEPPPSVSQKVSKRGLRPRRRHLG